MTKSVTVSDSIEDRDKNLINVVFLIELETEEYFFLQSCFRISIGNTFGHTDWPQARKYRKLCSDTFYLFELNFGKRDFLLVAVLEFFFDNMIKKGGGCSPNEEVGFRFIIRLLLNEMNSCLNFQIEIYFHAHRIFCAQWTPIWTAASACSASVPLSINHCRRSCSVCS